MSFPSNLALMETKKSRFLRKTSISPSITLILTFFFLHTYQGKISITLKLVGGGESPLPSLLTLPACLGLFRQNTGFFPPFSLPLPFVPFLFDSHLLFCPLSAAKKAADPIELPTVVKMVVDGLYSIGVQLHLPYVQYLAEVPLS